MNFLLHFGLINVIVVCKVFSAPSCSTEKNFRANKEETSCINLGLSIIPLNDIPKNTAILILSSNNFKSLSTSRFKDLTELMELDASDNGMTSFVIDLPLKLLELNLANNTLETMPMVSKLPELTTLQLSNNRITTIPENAFMGLIALTTLELQHNRIDSLDEKVFEGLQSLKHLDLSYNQLLRLPDRLLFGLESLGIFYLSGNNLTGIPENFFEDLELNYVYLEKNPWYCNCKVEYFKKWLEEDEDRVYEISKDGPTKNIESVICHEGTPLIRFTMDHCRGKGDVDTNSVPIHPKSFVTIWTNTPLPTTKHLLTEKPTTELRVTKWWPTSTPTEATTTLRTTTSTTKETTTLRTTTSTTKETTTLRTTTPTPKETTTLRTTTPTTKETTTLRTTTSTTKETTMLRTTTSTTNPTTMLESTSTTESSPKTTPKSATTPYLMTLMMVTTKVGITTDIARTSEVPSSEDRASTVSPTEEPTEIPGNTMLPARSLQPAAFGMDWLVMVILKNCCLLHVIIYGLCIFLLLVGIIITTMCLLWIYCCNQDLHRWLPGIRLIRYSIRAPMSDEDILLVNNGAIESHFRDQSLAGVTKMLVLESDPRQQEIRYTSAIL